MSNIIRALRIMRGLTQKDVAKKLSIAEKTYCRKENNPDYFSLKEFRELSCILEVSPEIFFNGKVTDKVITGV